ncbi:unnamed protein product [Bursaphelenchus okinawaensis]|uniref:EGF-like domain-containing protein n=1 Tax=Bursaphelenchus okinawaensis TaxID=465554 RepID=A0A811KS94_9BILA|nr:unnamed protein product [Bursaphelenchus okinawaensis]CAG9112294.1 unnamed protein product [Bursaphelenchus okinawaensis]
MLLSYLLLGSFYITASSNVTTYLCGEPPDQYYSSTPCLSPLAIRQTYNSCPQDTTQIAECNGNNVFCSGLSSNGNQIPGVCYNGACCANVNPVDCLNNQGITTPLRCQSQCPQLAPCDGTSGYCCLHKSRINGLCPTGTMNSGMCTQPNSYCYVNGVQGTCTSNYVCCTNTQQSQCPTGSRPSGTQCQFNNQNCYALTLRGICVSNQCCVYSQDQPQCSGGGTVVGNGNCNQDYECQQVQQMSYCDRNIGRCCAFSQQCQTGETAQGTCNNNMNNQQCQSGNSYGICRSGICCVYQCSSTQSRYNGQTCTTQNQCRTNNYNDVATCENGHCCISTNNINQCPYGTSINYNIRCSRDSECPGSTLGRCVNNYCCVAQNSNGESVCRGYGMSYTGYNCQGNTNICSSQTQTSAVCHDGYCCSYGGVNPGNGVGYCYNGEASQKLCRYRNDCGSDQLCVNGLCCTHTGNEWKFACAGITAVASCTLQGTCSNQMSCTSSNYCCECPYGQSSGSCQHGCPIGYTCATNGYCCPSCANGREPVGSCYESRCSGQNRCSPGNICCPA